MIGPLTFPYLGVSVLPTAAGDFSKVTLLFHFKFPKAAPVLWFDWWRGGRYPRRDTWETPNTDPPDAPNDVFYSLRGLGPGLWAEPHFARFRTEGFGESDTVEATVLGTAGRQLADPASTGKQRSDAAAILAAWDEYQNRQEGATMAQATRSIHFTDEAPAGSQAVELVHADNLPAVPDAPTSIPAGALVGGAGISATRDGEGGPITVAIAAKGVTAAMLADGVAVSGPKGDKGEPGEPGTNGATGPAGVGVKSIALTVDADGKVTGGTLTKTDNTTSPITVTTATA